MLDLTSFPTEFVPVSQILVQEFDYQTAYVFGVVWRYCQMEEGVCNASHESIAGTAGMARRTVIPYIEKLIKAGYIEDLTPDIRNRPHDLCTKKGVQKLHTKEQEYRKEQEKRCAENAHQEQEKYAKSAQQTPSGMQELPTSSAKSAHQNAGGMQNLHLNRESLNCNSIEHDNLSDDKAAKPTRKKPKEIDPELLPNSPEARILFAKINRNRQMNGRRQIKKFSTCEQKETCTKEYSRLGDDAFKKCLDYWLTRGVTALGDLTIKLTQWNLNGGTNAKHRRSYQNGKNGHQSDAGPDEAAIRAEIERLRRERGTSPNRQGVTAPT
jgi:hypothetical protein